MNITISFPEVERYLAEISSQTKRIADKLDSEPTLDTLALRFNFGPVQEKLVNKPRGPGLGK